MGNLIQFILHLPVVGGLIRSLTRVMVGATAVPLFRLFRRRVLGIDQLDPELEKDIEQWFRGSLLLLAATRNLEEQLFGWVPLKLAGEDGWVTMGFRLLMAVSVVEAMPDQDLFAIIHPGPPRLTFIPGQRRWPQIRRHVWPFCKGVLCQHINRSSPVFAIMAAIVPGTVGWICYGLAIAQYLAIGLVTSRDRALDVLVQFDRRVEERREQLIREFHLEGEKAAATPISEDPIGMIPEIGGAPHDSDEIPLPPGLLTHLGRSDDDGGRPPARGVAETVRTE